MPVPLAYPPRNVQMVGVTKIAYSTPSARPLKESGAGRPRLPASSNSLYAFILSKMLVSAVVLVNLLYAW